MKNFIYHTSSYGPDQEDWKTMFEIRPSAGVMCHQDLYDWVLGYSELIVTGLEDKRGRAEYVLEMHDGPLPTATISCDDQVIETIYGECLEHPMGSEYEQKMRPDNVLDFQSFKDKRDDADLDEYSEEILSEITDSDKFDEYHADLLSLGQEKFWTEWSEDELLDIFDGDSLYLDKVTGNLEWKNQDE